VLVVGVAVLAVGGYFLLSSVLPKGGSGGEAAAGGGQLAALTLPGCTTQVAQAKELSNVGTQLVSSGPQAFDVAVVKGHAFVSGGVGVTVMSMAQPVPARLGSASLSHSQGETLTPDHQHLLVTGGDGLAVFLVSQLKQGSALPVGTLHAPGEKHAVEVAVTPDGKFAFVTYQNSGHVGVFNLQQALTQGFAPGDLVGLIKVGPQPIGIAMSPDGDHVFVTSKQDNASPTSTGVVQVIDVQKAETSPESSVIQSVDAGCGASRVVTSADGKQVWVTASDSNALLGFDAAKLISGDSHALIARVPVGQLPLGLILVRGGSRIVVADSNRDKHPGDESNLAVVDVAKALAHDKSALLGYVRSGVTPRQFALASHGSKLLVTNTDSGQLQVLSVKQLP